MISQIVILTGGLGTRLRSAVKDIPKPMAPICGKPFLEYLVSLLKENGFKRFLFLTGYKSEVIKNYFHNGKKFGVKIDYVREEKLLGTAGAIFNAWEKLDDEFILINGDTFFDIQYEILLDFLYFRNVESLIVLKYSNNVSRYGFVEINDDYKVVKFIEKGKLPENYIDGYINGGIYYFRKKALKKYYNDYKGKNVSLENAIFPFLVKDRKLYGLPMGGEFVDIGIPKDYRNAQKLIPEILREERKPALFIDRDGTIIEDDGYIYGTNLVFKKEAIELMKKAENEGKLIIIVTNQAGVAKGKFTEKDSIMTTEYIIEYLNKLGVKINAYYYCPYHPEGIINEYRKISLLRKPNPGMILKATEDFRIDLKNSIMIGDNAKVDKIKLFGLKSYIINNS
ncbi:HAD-IIIA family hydrolase [Thermosipho ferrireducens]|uniref:HAD-IIIA family hydrolase n=1 Tax=Thermosipho ferrireducens TaxID=2571116 RepID=A0ABX7SAL9_9BACT|nr:HAD-IIIA family hydrolase [Thermosipho ferrireducens]QTA38491.1 HAD-IIIA family hydrolase [Thermosipho ferrireducens]